MQIVLNSDRIAVFFGDVGPIRLESDGCYIGPYFNPTHNSSNCELIDVVPPEFLVPGIFRRDADAWVAVDESQLEYLRNQLREQHNANQKDKRKAAYTEEADPLFFMAQRGEATVEQWQAKIAEIRARFPLDRIQTGNGEIPVTEF